MNREQPIECPKCQTKIAPPIPMYRMREEILKELGLTVGGYQQGVFTQQEMTAIYQFIVTRKAE